MHVDVRLDEVVLRALEKKPELRYQQVSEVKTCVEMIVGTPPGGSLRESAKTEVAPGAGPAPPDRSPHFSGAAIVGAAWTPFFLAAMLSITLGVEQFPQGYGSLSRLVLFLGLAAPLGTTILGWLATAQIRRSAGRLHGLELAVFDALLFPLLGLDGLVAILCLALAKTAARWRGIEGSLFVNLWDFALWTTLLVTIGAAIDFLIVRSVWRAVTQPRQDLRLPNQNRWRRKMMPALLCGLLTLGTISFTAAALFLCARNVDNVSLPFVNDPQAVGEWTSVDFVSAPEEFKPDSRSFQVDLPLFQHFSVLPEGRTSHRWLTWTKGKIINQGDRTAASYEIKTFGSTNFMFMEWKSGDYTLFHSKPWLYVLRRNGEATPGFYIGQTSFPKGDSIEITSVERSENQITVKGHYNLVSADNARLAFYITSTNATTAPEDSRQAMEISKGRGDFELVHPNVVPGLPHVNMYSATGRPFAELYFGTKSEALEESKLVLDHPKVVFVSPADGATNVDLTQEVRIRFDQPMNPNDLGINWSSGGFLPGGQPRYEPDRNEFVIPVRLLPGQTNDLAFNEMPSGGFRNTNLTYADEYHWHFTTKPFPTTSGAVKPNVVQISPAPGETLPVLTLLEITFDQSMMPPDQRLPYLSQRGWPADLPRTIPCIDYDPAARRFTIPLALPPDDDAKLVLDGFYSTDGVVSDPIVIRCQIGTNSYSSQQLEAISAAAQDPKLEQLLSAMQAARTRLSSGIETVQWTSLSPGFSENESYSGVTIRPATFKWQGTNHIYADISELMNMKAFILGSDGKTCWLYAEGRDGPRLASSPAALVPDIYARIADPFALTSRTVRLAIAEERLIYAGQAQLEGRTFHRVQSWKVHQPEGKYDRVSVARTEWWIDAETFLPLQLAQYTTYGCQKFNFHYEHLNQAIPDAAFQLPTTNANNAKQDAFQLFKHEVPAPDEKRFLTIKDGCDGQMSGRIGFRTPNGTTSSGLN